MKDENETYVTLLYGHLQRLIRRLRSIPPERWEWQPAPTTPSPRIVAQHAWRWLVCDRNHIREPDATSHPAITDAPTVQASLCDLLEQEAESWRSLLLTMTAERLSQPRRAFNWRPVNLRWLVYHMTGNVIYKHGQLATIYFMLGLDGTEPYRAPLPQDDYDRLADMMTHPPIRSVLCGSPSDILTPGFTGVDVDERDRAGCTALHYVAYIGDANAVEVLLQWGAAVDSEYQEGWTPLIDAAYLGHVDTVRVLLAHGASIHKRNSYGKSALTYAVEQQQWPVVEVLKQAVASD